MSFTLTPSRPRRRKLVSALLMIVLLASLVTFFQSTAAHADDVLSGTATNTSSSAGGGSPAGGVPLNGGSSCRPPTSSTTTLDDGTKITIRNTTIDCFSTGANPGYCPAITLRNPYSGNYVTAPATATNYAAVTVSTTTSIPIVRKLLSAAMGANQTRTNVFRGRSDMYGPLGQTWTSPPWPVLQNVQLVVPNVPLTYRSSTETYRINVAIGCVYPHTARTTTATCAISVGPMTFSGPQANAVTKAAVGNWPVPTSTGAVDPKTTPRKWSTPAQYSSFGSAWTNNRSIFMVRGNNPTAISYVSNCQDIHFRATISNSTCYYPATAATEKAWGEDICGFTPGNYLKEATGQKVQCSYYTFPNDWPEGAYAGTSKFNGCGGSYQCTESQCNINEWVSFTCTAPGGQPWRDDTTNFANPCGMQPPPSCHWVTSGSGGILDPADQPIGNGAQVTADGKVWTVQLPHLECPGVNVQNKWQQWNVANGSQPQRAGGNPGGSDAPVVGSLSKTSTTNVLTSNGSRSGANNWDNNNLYLRFYQASSAATSKVTVGAGEVGNPVTVATGSLVPFGVYTQVHFTVPQTVQGPGGPVVVNVPFTYTSPMVTLLPVSGRVAG